MTFNTDRPAASVNAAQAATDQMITGANPTLADIPLLDHESAEDLDGFRASAMDAIKPRDAIEAIWLQDFISYAWESLRLRRLKIEIVAQDRARILHNTLLMQTKPQRKPPSPSDPADLADIVEMAETSSLAAIIERFSSGDLDALDDLTQKWVRGEPDAIQEVNKLLADIGLDMNDISTSTFAGQLEFITRVDKLIGHYDQRRDSAIKELEKRRDTLARRAYVFSQTFSDASFDEDEND